MLPRTILLILVIGLFIACASDDDIGETAVIRDKPVGSATASATSEPSVSPSAAVPSAAAPSAAAKDTPGAIPDITLTPAFPGLDRSTTGNLPVMLRPIPGEAARFALVDQSGVIYSIFNGPESQAAELFLDITGRVRTNGREEGLLGMAFDPEFESNGRFYAYYSASSPRRTVLSRFHHSAGGPEETASSEQVLLEIKQPFPNHNGGMIEFGPDGFLYVGLGDGGSGGDPTGNGQNRSTLLGSLLRIDVSGDAAAYRIPADNPFAGEPDSRGEIWAYGLRNPWRFSFDQAGGNLWLADVGQQRLEEIDLIVKGGNYGWNITEGTDCFRSSSCDRSGLAEPVFAYDHSLGCSITGGYVYRGSAIPDLQGTYVYGDFCSGRIWGLRYAGGEVVEQRQIATAAGSISSFAQDAAGELYVLTFSEGVLRIEAEN
ncbi:MAG: PQQ-dependent sugar dehydrogenase [Chloroflexi bacterium]|nr:PQQ-dependent sugar dehydrogenase [Chloroflexota bacterium]